MTEPLTGEQFGQRRPPLSVTIKGILERYPDGQIFKVRWFSYIHIAQIAQRIDIAAQLFAGDYSECRWCRGKDGEVFHRQQEAWNDVARGTRIGPLPGIRAVGVQRCAVQRRGLGGYTELAAQRQGRGSLQSGKIWNWIQLRLPHHRFIKIIVWGRQMTGGASLGM